MCARFFLLVHCYKTRVIRGNKTEEIGVFENSSKISVWLYEGPISVFKVTSELMVYSHFPQ